MAALSVLKDEAVSNYLTISKLNARSFSKELNQDLKNIEQSIINISSFLNLSDEDKSINIKLKTILSNYPQIRSINILKNRKIVYSTNKYNIDLVIKKINLFPNTIFDDNILKFSTPWIGRDFIDGTNVYNNDELIQKKASFFIPISKKVKSKDIDFEVVITLNFEYFTNRFLSNIESDNIIFEIIRLDGILLLTTQNNNTIGINVNSNLLAQAIEKNEISGMEIDKRVRYLSTYILTDDYPLTLAVKLNYEKNLISWNKKQYTFFIITVFILVVSILISLLLFYLYNRKKEEELLWHKLEIQSQEKFKLLFQDSHFLAVVINSNGEILELNNLAVNFLGHSSEELKEDKFWDLKCWDSKDINKIKELLLNPLNKPFQGELLMYDKNMNKKIIDFTLSYLPNSTENICVAIGLDITQRKNKEVKLQQAYTVFDNTKDGIIITDKDTHLIDINRAFEEITGYTKNEVINKKTNILKSNYHSKEFYENMWNSIIKDGYWEGEINNLTKDGKQYTEWLTINSILNKRGEVLNYIGVFSDITEQKVQEKLLKEKNDLLYQKSKMAAMGEMIENIAHQWRQPLSVISAAATGMLIHKEIGVSSDEEEKESLKAINNSSQYLSKTIDDFRNFLKNDRELKVFNIQKTIEEAIALSSVKTKSEEINLVLSLNNFQVYGIKNEFIQVIINIINNAKDELKRKKIKNKYLFISVQKDQSNIHIKIKDNAGGIPADILERVFEPYFTTKHQSQGTGIGLYMSEEIIRNHMKGQIYVKNEKYKHENIEHIGACFYIILPTN